ncbi:MAG: hypothetical protein JWO09_548 [Bacteroidetes bacterium]|nr:hypothetical protein [Bacteroidota bacterium]
MILKSAGSAPLLRGAGGVLVIEVNYSILHFMRFPISVALGLLAGLILSIGWYAMGKSIGFYSVQVFINVYILKLCLIIAGVFISVYLVKRRNNGFLEFKTALQTGMLYCLVFAVIAAIFNYIYYTYITPDTIDYFVAEAKKYAEGMGNIKGDDLTKFLDAERSRFGSFAAIPPILFWGLIVSLIAGLIFQKKDPHAFSAN